MNAETLVKFCAIRELDYIEQGMSHGVKGAWFQTRKRERRFFSEDELREFNEKVKSDSNRHARVNPSFTS
ncbi:MAG: hypothetical protein H6840_12465 [Planctomycetes bacterium]|nr:hypothetical protein [Planctomycetota bacterium]